MKSKTHSINYLSLFCTFIWVSVVILLVLLVIKYDNRKMTVIEGNVNIYCTSNDFKDAINFEMENCILNLQRIYSQESPLAMYQISYEDASRLCYLIAYYANKYAIDLYVAMTLVAVESSFKETVYNSRGKAYGLCQVTEPCLTEYNYYHNTNYTVQMLRNANINLEVGFWYFNRIMNHYNNNYNYIRDFNLWVKTLDTYIAYNYGVTNFARLRDSDRDSLRAGYYPNTEGTKATNYGAREGDEYKPYKRLLKMYNKIIESGTCEIPGVYREKFLRESLKISS